MSVHFNACEPNMCVTAHWPSFVVGVSEFRKVYRKRTFRTPCIPLKQPIKSVALSHSYIIEWHQWASPWRSSEVVQPSTVRRMTSSPSKRKAEKEEVGSFLCYPCCFPLRCTRHYAGKNTLWNSKSNIFFARFCLIAVKWYTRRSAKYVIYRSGLPFLGHSSTL